MSTLKPGTLCVIVAGCPENIGLLVEVVAHLGSVPPRDDAYVIKTASGRPFPQLRIGNREQFLTGYSERAVTDRYKLRPLVGPGSDAGLHGAKVVSPVTRGVELAPSPMRSATSKSLDDAEPRREDA